MIHFIPSANDTPETSFCMFHGYMDHEKLVYIVPFTHTVCVDYGGCDWVIELHRSST